MKQNKRACAATKYLLIAGIAAIMPVIASSPSWASPIELPCPDYNDYKVPSSTEFIVGVSCPEAVAHHSAKVKYEECGQKCGAGVQVIKCVDGTQDEPGQKVNKGRDCKGFQTPCTFHAQSCNDALQWNDKTKEWEEGANVTASSEGNCRCDLKKGKKKKGDPAP